MARLGTLKSINQETKSIGLTVVAEAIKSILLDLVLFFHVGKAMSEDQVNQTVILIMDDKKYLSMLDLQLMSKKAKAGAYGKLFDRIDGGVIFDFINQYEKEKEIEAEHQSYIEHNSFKKKLQKDDVSEIHPESKKIIEDIKSRLDADIANERTERLAKMGSKNVDYSNYNIEQRFLTQFDKLHRKWGYKPKLNESTALKFIHRYGLVIGYDEFLSIKKQKAYRVIRWLSERNKTLTDLKKRL